MVQARTQQQEYVGWWAKCRTLILVPISEQEGLCNRHPLLQNVLDIPKDEVAVWPRSFLVTPHFNPLRIKRTHNIFYARCSLTPSPPPTPMWTPSFREHYTSNDPTGSGGVCDGHKRGSYGHNRTQIHRSH